jgi:hypothetical protein
MSNNHLPDVPNPGELLIYCRYCDVAHAVQCTEEQNKMLLRRTDGEIILIQDIFPDMPVDLREMFISGMCRTCWDKVFRDPHVVD